MAILLCLDFDGTLIPIMDDPDEAHLAPPTRRLLASLARKKGFTVAVISGRSLADVRSRVGLGGLVYAGNHGLEISSPDFRYTETCAQANRAQLQQLARRLAPLGAAKGAKLENKGLTLALHFRGVAPEEQPRLKQNVEAVMAETGGLFSLTAGKKVYDIRPNIGWHKGTAVEWIRARSGGEGSLVLYAGDDTTDEDAFRALQKDITIKVGDAAVSAAKYFLAGQREVNTVLTQLEQSF